MCQTFERTIFRINYYHQIITQHLSITLTIALFYKLKDIEYCSILKKPKYERSHT